MIDGDAAEGRPEIFNQIAVIKRPRRIPMEHQYRVTFALVHIVNAIPLAYVQKTPPKGIFRRQHFW
jgi:hypothetical protein